jgi:hypothetical protein
VFRLKLSSEALIVIVDSGTSKIHIGRDARPNEYLLRMQSQAPEAALSIAAIAPRRGRATVLVRKKLHEFRIRNSWFASPALDVVRSVCRDAPPIPRLDEWIDRLVVEAQTGAIIPITALVGVDRRYELDDITRLGQQLATNKPEVYDHPRRRPGRPRRSHAPLAAVVERDLKPANIIEPPAWLRALAKRAQLPSLPTIDHVCDDPTCKLIHE